MLSINLEELPLEKKALDYNGIVILKYIAAIFVIIVHTSPLFPNVRWLNYSLSNGIGRLAVPLFFIASGFFVRGKITENPRYLNSYFKKIVKLYFWWSIVYLPLGISWLNHNMNVPSYLYPVALIIGFVYIGTYYHLWYIPALIFAVWFVNWLVKRVSYTNVLIIGAVLYGLGTLETYYGVIQNQIVIKWIDQYMAIFQTTRNGLFFGVIFVAIGFFINDNENKMRRFARLKYLLPSLLLFACELVYIFDKPRLNANFLVMVVPVALFLFLMAKDCSLILPIKFGGVKLNTWTSFYYFGHLLFYVLWEQLASLFGFSEFFASQGWLRFVLVIVSTHLGARIWQACLRKGVS